jgi:3-hydroxyacyl-CoA dehydrogenase
LFEIPSYITQMVEKGWLGSKTGQGFFKKVGKDILELNLQTLEYQPAPRVDFPTLESCEGRGQSREADEDPPWRNRQGG